MSALDDEVTQFLYREARLMDDNRYGDWLGLFADPCTYWVPSNAEAIDPDRHVSILYADRRILESFVKRLVDGKAFAQSPASRLRRMVSNIEIEETDTIAARANFLIVEVRKHVQRLHAGSSEYRLTRDADGLRIEYKKVMLLGLDEHQDNVTFLL